MRPPQTEAIRSSLLTTRSRFSQQVNQQIEHLRLDGDRSGAAPQLAPVHVKSLIAKDKLHFRRPADAVLEAIIKAISRANQAAVKAFSSCNW